MTDRRVVQHGQVYPRRRRGNLQGSLVSTDVLWSIPAQAGEPKTDAEPEEGERVYPRAGGGTVSPPKNLPIVWGLSPRRRGNPPNCATFQPYLWSIPAQGGGTSINQNVDSTRF